MAQAPEDHLPLEPEITPGFAVAGVILVCTGVLYAVVGIKTRWVHSFLTTAFLGSLGTSVLIFYVMTPPVGRAIQGVYVVAVVCTGLILGGLGVVFKEITGCLACLLGGFCLSMWLLTLQPGGVIQQIGGKVAFISAFTLAGFGIYFAPWTRNYNIISCTSFSGATIAVLGIDCFSRAGYKEFWAYLWALNDNLFPLGTSSYPHNRGIRVEIAITMLIFLAGVVSQLKLWSIIKDHRSKRDAERAEGERTRRTEEENVGRQVEEMAARERRQWERIYGDGAISPLGGSADSGVGDMASEKRIHIRNGVISASAAGVRSQSPSGTVAGAGILDFSIDEAMTPFQVPEITAAERVISKDDHGARITVMVAQDDMPSGPILEGPVITRPKEVHLVGPEEGSRHQQEEYSIPSAWQSKSLALSSSPNITPLPFTVPEEPAVEEVEEEDRSTVATFADGEEEDEPRPRSATRQGLADSVVNRLSSGSANLLRSLSQRSKRNNDGHGSVEAETGESREDLLVEIPRAEGKDESDSVAANQDDLSSVSDLASCHSWETPQEYQQLDTNTAAGKPQEEGDSKDAVVGEAPQQDIPQSELGQITPVGLASTSSSIQYNDDDNTASNPVYSSSMAAKSGPALAQEDKKQDEAVPEQALSTRDSEGRDIDTRRTSIDSVAASLTKGNLPSGLSRVARSYRTNEWAKHLSIAETPEPETLKVGEDPADDSCSDAASEGPAPLDVAELTQTAENAAPPPAAPRSASALSNYHNHAITRSSSRMSLSQPYRSLSGTLKGRTSGLLAQPIAEEGTGGDGDGASNGNSIPTAVPEEDSLASSSRDDTPSPGPRELSTPTPTPNLSMWLGGVSPQPHPSPQQTQSNSQTLMGVREMLIRTKASAGLLTTPTPAEAIYSNMSNSDLLLHRAPSEAESINNSPLYSAGVGANIDEDDIPLAQRRAMIRQSSSLGTFVSLSGSVAGAGKSRPSSQQHPYRSQSRMSIHGQYNNSIQTPTAEASAFDSHQPARKSNSPPEAVRQAQLANFRSSVAADLRAVTPIDGPNPSGYGGGWDSPSPYGTPFGHGYGHGHGPPAMLNPSFGLPGGSSFNGGGGSNAFGSSLIPTTSMASLRGPYNTNVSTNIAGVGSAGLGMGGGAGGMAEVQRTLETQRSFMMGQKEMEMARREAERIEAERVQREFHERMRSGELMEAHRDALRRMQAMVRE